MPPKPKVLNFFIPFIDNAPPVTETVTVKTAYYEAKHLVSPNGDGTTTPGFHVRINMPGIVSVTVEAVFGTNAFTFTSNVDTDLHQFGAPRRYYLGFILLDRRAQLVINPRSHISDGVFYAFFPNCKGALHLLTYPHLNNTLQQGSSQDSGLINQKRDAELQVDDLARLLTARCTLLDKSNSDIKEEVRSLKIDFLRALSDEDPLPLCEIVGHFGSGVFGKVFKGVDKATNKTIAVKTIPLQDGKFDLHILRELDALFAIEHENVVRLHYAFPGVGCINLAMESCDNDLRRLISRDSRVLLDPRLVKNIMVQILSGVAFLHRQKIQILHRDLKPENILFREDTDKIMVKLADFGLARFIGDRLTPQVTSLLYRAPEVLLGAAIYTAAVDVWSVGCVFGELVELRPFFCPTIEVGNREHDMIHAIFRKLGCPTNSDWPGVQTLANYPADVSQFEQVCFRNSKLDEDGNDLLLRLLSLNPEKRIGAAEALKHPYFHGKST